MTDAKLMHKCVSSRVQASISVTLSTVLVANLARMRGGFMGCADPHVFTESIHARTWADVWALRRSVRPAHEIFTSNEAVHNSALSCV